MPKTREERKAQTREALIRAGCDVVRQRGFAASVGEIAGAAGFTKGAVYSNFESRIDLIEAIAHRLVPGFQIPLDEDAPSLVDAMEKTGRTLARLVDEDPEQVVLMLDLFVTGARDPQLRAAFLKPDPGSEGRPHPQASWELPVDADWFAMVGNSLGIGLAMSRLMFGREKVPDELFAWAHRQLAGGR